MSVFRSTARFYALCRPPYPPELFADLLDLVKPSRTGRLVDLACGTGQVAIPLHRHFRDIIAVDLEPEMVALRRPSGGASADRRKERRDMTRTKNFEELRQRLRGDTKARAQVETYRDALRAVLALTELREARGVTQQHPVVRVLHERRAARSHPGERRDEHHVALAVEGGRLPTPRCV